VLLRQRRNPFTAAPAGSVHRTRVRVTWIGTALSRRSARRRCSDASLPTSIRGPFPTESKPCGERHGAGAPVPGRLATTTQRECCRVWRSARRTQAGFMPDAEKIPDEQTGMAEQELLVAERNAALREAFAHLPPCCQRLIAMLIEDPPWRTPRSAPSWASRWGASGPPAAAALRSCAAIQQSPL
jgi:hypothetical protein